VLGSNLFDELRILRKIYMCAERNGFNRNLPLDRRALQRNDFLGFIGDLLYIMGFLSFRCSVDLDEERKKKSSIDKIYIHGIMMLSSRYVEDETHPS